MGAETFLSTHNLCGHVTHRLWVLGNIRSPPSGMQLGLGRGNVQWFRGGLVFEAHRLFVSLNSRLESNQEEEEEETPFLQVVRNGQVMSGSGIRVARVCRGGGRG